MRLFVLILSLLVLRSAWAEQTVLRIASMAPEGSAWTREFRAFGREVEAATDEVRFKWYFSGVAGDEPEESERVKRGQLDGAVGSANLCMRYSASMRVLTIAGLFRDIDEALYVMNRMKPILDAEFRKAGVVNLADASMGFHILLSRNPIRSVEELKKYRFWVWDLDQVLARQLSAMTRVVPLPVEQAARAYDENRVDGFVAVPTAALAYQWSLQAHYVSALRVSFLPGCLLVSARAFDQLSLDTQQKMRAAAAKLQLRVQEFGRRQDELLLRGKLLAKQGLQYTPVTDAFRAQFIAAAHEAEPGSYSLLPPGVRLEVAKLLAEYRRQHSEQSSR